MASFYKKLALVLFSAAFLPAIASAASLSIVPANATLEVGDTITVQVLVSSGESINAISGKILADPAYFSIQTISKTGSILNFWVTDPSFEQAAGTASFEGVALNGFQGSSAKVISFQVRALKTGMGKISIQSGQILANDGNGTDITGDLSGASFTVKESTSNTHVVQPPRPAEPAPVQPAEPVQTEAPQPAPSLNAPEIMSGNKYGASSVIGTSQYPKAQVLMSFAAADGSKTYIIGTAEADGSFNIVLPNSLKHGDYSVSAVMIKNDKTNSEKSNVITVTIGNVFSDVSPVIFGVIVLLLLAILYLLARLHRHVSGDQGMRKRVKRDAEKAEKLTHKAFDILRDEVSEFKDERTPAERRKMTSDLKSDIDDAEKAVEKEIKDIGSS